MLSNIRKTKEDNHFLHFVYNVCLRERERENENINDDKSIHNLLYRKTQIEYEKYLYVSKHTTYSSVMHKQQKQ